MSLKDRAFSGIRWTTFSSLACATLQLLQVVVLAHLLKPEDFGLMAIVTSITVFLQIFADAGVSNAIIHFQKISQEQLSSLYWLNVLVSLMLGLGLAVAAPWVAHFYGQKTLLSLVDLAAVTLVAGSVGQQLKVVSQKALRFSELAKIEVTSAVAGFIAAISVALLGGGVYALISSALTGAIVGSALAWSLLAGGWRPMARLKLGEIHVFLKFGSYIIGTNLVSAVHSQVDILLGGRLLGAQAIGLYGLPKNLTLRIAGIFNPIITRVSLPVMARAQNDRARLRSVYLQTMRMTSSVNFPIYMGMAFFAPEVVHFALGARWEACIPLFRIFSIWALVRSTGNPIGGLVMAVGKPELEMKWNLAWLLIMPAAIWFGSTYGTIGMSCALLIAIIAAFVPNWYFLVRPLCGARLLEYCQHSLSALLLSFGAVVLGRLCADALDTPLARLLVGGGISVAAYLALSFLFNKPWCRAMGELLHIPRLAKA